MTKRRLLAATALFALLAVPFLAGTAEAARGKRNPADILHNPRALARFLKLTPEQVETMKQLGETLRSTTKPLHEQLKPLHEELRGEIDSGADACTVGETVLEIHAVREQIREAVEAFDAAFSAILTPEQLARYEALKEAAKIGEEEAQGGSGGPAD